MKKLINIFLFILLCTSCNGFLDEKNKGGIGNEDLYKTAEGFQTLRVNAYNQLRLLYRNVPYLQLAGTDLYQMPRGMSANGIYDYINLNDQNGDVATFYKNAYIALQVMNTAEYYLPGVELSDDTKRLYKAEIDFLKGFIHLLLIEQFGGIVINDEYTQSPRMNMPRSSLADSYEYAIGKLVDALAGPLPQTTKNGTINKDIVNHYLAKAYLTRGWDLGNTSDFDTAKSHASSVITSRGGSLKYAMEELWSASNENNDEILFAVQFDANSIPSITEGNDQEALFGPYLGGSERNHKYMRTVLYPSWSLHSWFDKNDARYEATFMLTIWERYYDYYQNKTIPGVNAITALYPRVWDKDKAEEIFNDYLKIATNPEDPDGPGEKDGQFINTHMTDGNGNLRAGVVEFIKKWCPEYADVTPVNAKAASGQNYLRVYPFIENKADPKVNEKYWRTGYNNDFCQPGIKKFDMNKLVTFSTNQSYRDVVLATLSETMLLYAEACLGKEDYPGAQEYINKVLARPENSKNAIPLTVTLPTSKEAALEVYLKESGKELVGQYCGRWPELRRTKMLKTMFYKYNYDYQTLGADPIGQKLYRPIPQDAITLNDGLSEADQNPGY